MMGPRGFRVLVCGGRNFGEGWGEVGFVYETLDALHAIAPISFVVHGNARGADYLAHCWVHRERATVKEIACPADWAKHGKRAGPIRNQNMLGHLRPEAALVIAFPGGAGTRDMVKRARGAGFRVVEVSQERPLTAQPDWPGCVSGHEPDRPSDGSTRQAEPSNGLSENKDLGGTRTPREAR